MTDRAVVRSINEPVSARQSFTPTSINEPPQLPALDVPAPVITGYDPYEATIGAESFALVITGENFFAGTVINFAGYDEPTTHNEDGTVSTIVNMDVWHGPDTVEFYVHNGEKASQSVGFVFLPPAGMDPATVSDSQLGLEAAGVDYEDPDEMEEELEQAEEEGDVQTLHRGKPTTTLSNKRSKAKRR